MDTGYQSREVAGNSRTKTASVSGQYFVRETLTLATFQCLQQFKYLCVQEVVCPSRAASQMDHSNNLLSCSDGGNGQGTSCKRKERSSTVKEQWSLFPVQQECYVIQLHCMLFILLSFFIQRCLFTVSTPFYLLHLGLNTWSFLDLS